MVSIMALASFALGCVACPLDSSACGVLGKREMVDSPPDLPVDDTLGGFLEAPPKIQIQTKFMFTPAQPLSIILLSLGILLLAVLCLGLALFARRKAKEKRLKDGWELMPRFEKGVSWNEVERDVDGVRDARELEEYEVGLAKRKEGKLKARSVGGAEAERVIFIPWARPPTLVNAAGRGETHLIDLSEPMKREEASMKSDGWGGETWNEDAWGDEANGDVALRKISRRKGGRDDDKKRGAHLTRPEEPKDEPLVDLSDHSNSRVSEYHDSRSLEVEEEDVVEETHSRRTSVATLVDIHTPDPDPLPLVAISPKSISKLPSKLSNLLVLMDHTPALRNNTEEGEDVLVDTSVPVSPLVVVNSTPFSGDLIGKEDIGVVHDSIPPSPLGMLSKEGGIESCGFANTSVAILEREEFPIEVEKEDNIPHAIVEVDMEVFNQNPSIHEDDVPKVVIKSSEEQDKSQVAVQLENDEGTPESTISLDNEGMWGDNEFNLTVVPPTPQILCSSVLDEKSGSMDPIDLPLPAATQEEQLGEGDETTIVPRKLVVFPPPDEEEEVDFQDAHAPPPTPPQLVIFPPTNGGEDNHDGGRDDNFQDAFSTPPFVTPSPTPVTPSATFPGVVDYQVSPLSTPPHTLRLLLDVDYSDPPLPILPPIPPNTSMALDPDDLPLPDLPLPVHLKSSPRRLPLQTRDMNVGGTRPAWSVRALGSPALGVATAIKGSGSSPSSPASSSGSSQGSITPKPSMDFELKTQAPDSPPLSPCQKSEPSAPDPPSPTTEVAPVPKMRRGYRAVLEFDIALAMQLRPGLGIGADPAWMVRFLMSMFGWFAVMLTGQVRRREGTIR